MGSTGQPFARNVPFDATFPDLAKNEIVINRHGDRLGLLKPDPQVISRKLFSRAQAPNNNCNDAQGLPDSAPEANCDYQKAPVLNVLAAFWVQFMTHDWFSHLEEGHNQSELMAMGCAAQHVNNSETPLTPEKSNISAAALRIASTKATSRSTKRPANFTHGGKEYLSRAHKTTLNKVTAWWDASQIYGYNELLGSASSATSRSGEISARAGPHLDARSDGLPSRATDLRSHEPAVVRPGGHGVPGQLVHRSELFPQRLCARAQYVRRCVSTTGCGNS